MQADAVNWGTRMTDGRKDKDLFSDDALEDLFAQARGEAQEIALPEALMARILSDADTVQSAREADFAPVSAQRGRSGLRGIFAAIGGFPAVAGLAAATVAGLWIGITPPAALQSGMQAVTGATASEEIFDFYVVDSADTYDFTQVEG